MIAFARRSESKSIMQGIRLKTNRFMSINSNSMEYRFFPINYYLILRENIYVKTFLLSERATLYKFKKAEKF